MTTKVVAAGSIKVGSYMLIDGAPCRVVDSTHSKSGKHGAAKMRFLAVGLIDEKKRDVVMPASDSVEVPIVEKKSAQVLSVVDNKANIMDMETYETFDMEIPEELKGKVVSGCEVLYWEILSQKVMKQVKGGE